jgi:magnesium-transporting ATPase (P-type)
MIPDETRVLGGKTIAIATDELVPGDVVLLEAGNRIPLMFVLSKPIN